MVWSSQYTLINDTGNTLKTNFSEISKIKFTIKTICKKKASFVMFPVTLLWKKFQKGKNKNTLLSAKWTFHIIKVAHQ